MVKARVYRTPLSIKIAVGLWLLVAAIKIATMVGMLFILAPFGAQMIAVNSQAFGVVFALYHAFALSRLSRWPILAQPVVAAVGIFGLDTGALGWLSVYPASGPAMILPLLIFPVLTLPHWRKMNWAMFGQPYRPSDDQVEAFA